MLLSVVVLFIAFFVTTSALAADHIVNVYTWSGEIPRSVIVQFEKETGIKVNYSTFDSNEIMYTKFRAAKNPGYDVIEPSSYYIDRMRHQGMLTPLNKARLPNLKNI